MSNTASFLMVHSLQGAPLPPPQLYFTLLCAPCFLFKVIIFVDKMAPVTEAVFPSHIMWSVVNYRGDSLH